MYLLEVNNIQKRFGETQVLKGVSFSLQAGQVLGMTKSQIFFKVVLLQVVKRILPPMSNEIITLVKDTSLARVIAIYEIIYVGQNFIKKGMAWPLFGAGIFFLLFTGLLTLLFSYTERKLDYFRG